MISYTFGLLAPSELLRQAQAPLLKCHGLKISYGPIRRKEQLQTLSRWCTCRTDRLICVHDWLEALVATGPRALYFGSHVCRS